MMNAGQAAGDRPNEIRKQAGVTTAERRLSQLCHHSFLSLWSYPAVFRDQGTRGGLQDGKEVCDLLVVFGNDVIIFSDKDCSFPQAATIDVAWSRWFRRAVLKSAEQAWGAERWLREHPDRVFLDRKCTRPFPISLPDKSVARFHRIVVAHSAAAICKEMLGGTGSLMIRPSLKGDDHHVCVAEGADAVHHIESMRTLLHGKAKYDGKVIPFMIGDVDPSHGYVHVFDDTSLEMVMACLDTISDFVTYLTKKEDVVRSGRLLFAAGEDDLLAYYLQETDGGGGHAFNFPDESHGRVVIAEGEWELLRDDPEWVARKEADRVSYFWDGIIEKFSSHIMDGTSSVYPRVPFARQEMAVRAMARESRFHRRLLSVALGEFVRKPHTQDIAARLVGPIRKNGPHYVFLTVRPDPCRTEEEYRKARLAITSMYSLAVKSQYPDASEVILIATEPMGSTTGYSEDVLYRDLSALTPEEIAEGKHIQEKFKYLTKLGGEVRGRAYEYPLQAFREATGEVQRNIRKKKSARNSLCSCGSMKKAKRCCLA